MRKSLKPLLLLLVVKLLLLTFLAGCVGEQKKGSPGSPVKGGSIVIGCDQEPVTLNPFSAEGASFATRAVTSNILWGLLGVSPELGYVPRIAESVPTLENGLVTENPFSVTYKIDRRATWSDGTPITSWDIKFTWDTIMDPKRNITDRSGYDMIERIYTPDEKTVKLVFREPYADYKDLFSTTFPIMPKHILEDYSYDDVLDEFISFASGPYKFNEWERGRHLTIVRNELFWRDPAYIDSVTFKYAPKTGGQVSSFADGKLDAVFTVDTASLEQLRELGGKEIKNDPGLAWEHVAFNLSRQPLDDVNVRKAIAHAIDREKTALNVTGNNKVLNSVFMPTQKTYYEPAWKKYDFDTGKAKKYLEKAGYREGARGIYEKNGKPLVLTLSIISGDFSREKAAKIMKEDLEAAGIGLEIRSAGKNNFFGSRIPRGDFDMAIWAWPATPEPKLDYLFASDRIPPAGLNYYRYSDAEATKTIKSLSGILQIDKRASAYKKVQEKISDDAVVIPLYQRPQILAHDKRINGVKSSASFEGPFWNLSEWWIFKE